MAILGVLRDLQAIECRKTEEAEACVQKGLEAAVTEQARAKLVSRRRARCGNGQRRLDALFFTAGL